MSTDRTSPTHPVHAAIYQIRIKGQLDSEWATWFEGLSITLADDDETLLTGPVRDQATLYGLLKKVRNLGLPLLSVNCIEGHQPKSNMNTEDTP